MLHKNGSFINSVKTLFGNYDIGQDGNNILIKNPSSRVILNTDGEENRLNSEEFKDINKLPIVTLST